MWEPIRILAPIIAAFVLLMAVLMWAFGGLLNQRNNPNAALISGDGAPQRVVLERNPFGQYLAPGSINGGAVTFLVDTGADHVAIPANVAETLNLKRGRSIQVITAGGLATAYRTHIDRISLGGISFEGVEGSINPAMHGQEILLGMSFLRHVDFQKTGDQLIIEANARQR